MRLATSLLVLLLVLSIAQALNAWPRMPEPMAAHFDGSGAADGWSSRAFFFGVSGAADLLIAGIFLGLPVLTRRLPDAAVSLPHKHHWLAPERREETLRYIHEQTRWFGVATLLLLVYVKELVLRANLALVEGGEARLHGSFAWVLGAYLVGLVVWLVPFVRRFREPR